jgi:hypothetical protein
MLNDIDVFGDKGEENEFCIRRICGVSVHFG